jgi:hypothetical protein
MTNFEFVFSLLVILLGLGLGQVLTGLASAVKRRPALKIGWGTGLLATWVATETVLFWTIIWRTRDTLPDATAALFGGSLITGLYYFAGALVFPDELAGRSSLDDYFMAEKSKVIGALLAAITLALLLRPLVIGSASWSVLSWVDWLAFALIYGLGSVAMVTRHRRVAVACLAALVLQDLAAPILGALGVDPT